MTKRSVSVWGRRRWQTKRTWGNILGRHALYSEWWCLCACTNLSNYIKLSMSTFLYESYSGIQFFNHKKLSMFSQFSFSEGELTLLSATTKGHFLDFRRLIDSIVWGSKPCIISTTKMAISQRELPLFLRLLLKRRKKMHE